MFNAFLCIKALPPMNVYTGSVNFDVTNQGKQLFLTFVQKLPCYKSAFFNLLNLF